jgi:hypothetical protein
MRHVYTSPRPHDLRRASFAEGPLSHPPATSHEYLCALVGGSPWPSLSLPRRRGADIMDGAVLRSSHPIGHNAELLEA